MIFEKAGRWWMLTNIDPVRVEDHCSELSLFSAGSPFAASWEPHPSSPIMVDASRARNAGYLTDGDSYFRCAQGQGFDSYGKRVVINEVTELSVKSYRELRCAVVAPSFHEGAAGIHHLHSNGKITVFDVLTSSRLKAED